MSHGPAPDSRRSRSASRTSTRRLVAITVGADDPDDLDRAAAGLAGMGVLAERRTDRLVTEEPASHVAVHVAVAPRVDQPAVPATPYNGPGRIERAGVRAPGILRSDRVRPRKLGHVVLGSTDVAATERFFLDGIGFKLSDRVAGAGAFMRCSTDHHNVLALNAPVSFLHHTSWQVDDVDDVGRGAAVLLGAASPAVVPAPGRPRRADDRRAPAGVSGDESVPGPPGALPGHPG